MMTISKQRSALAIIKSIEGEVMELLFSETHNRSIDAKRQVRDWAFGMEMAMRRAMMALDPNDYYNFGEFNDSRDRIKAAIDAHTNSKIEGGDRETS